MSRPPPLTSLGRPNFKLIAKTFRLSPWKVCRRTLCCEEEPEPRMSSSDDNDMNASELELKFGKDAEANIEPREVILAVLGRYHKKKTIFREAANFYFHLNLFLFYLPLLFVQCVTSILSSISTMEGIQNPKHFSNAVVVLHAVNVVWIAAQLKFRWGEKADKDQEAMLKYRNLEWENRQYHLILEALPKTVKPLGILKHLNLCHSTEKKILLSDCKVPWHISKRYNDLMDSTFDHQTEIKLDAIPKVKPPCPSSSAPHRSTGTRTLHYGEDYEQDMDPFYLLNRMQKRYWRRKNLYREAYRFYWYLSLCVFFAPTMAIQVANTVVPMLVENHETRSIITIVLNSVVTLLVAAQMKLMWGEKSVQCESIFFIYRLLESEVNYRFLLLEEGVKVTDLVAFSWACRELERKGVTTAPRMPACLVAMWRQKLPESRPHRVVPSTDDSPNQPEPSPDAEAPAEPACVPGAVDT